jgi:tRNA pseudouridine38-40 synthase
VRTLTKVSVRRRGDLVTVTVIGDAFLRGMVRRIVAALLRVGHGRASATELTNALSERRPAFHGEAAAPRGLTLWRVPMGERHKTRNTEEQDNLE